MTGLFISLQLSSDNLSFLVTLLMELRHSSCSVSPSSWIRQHKVLAQYQTNSPKLYLQADHAPTSLMAVILHGSQRNTRDPPRNILTPHSKQSSIFR
mmetsp:Transcript_32911/g.49031  ORF Transcript_32911/g.49031 Transcript_32911/m.49031 type:complete len:97 (+) Transcript_32911:460-750(+)